MQKDFAAFALLRQVARVTTAFKEWAIVVDALGRGEQIFILRKGGIHEGRGGFKMEHPAFLLVPTLFHQQRDSVISAAQARYDEIALKFPSPDILRVEYWAEVIEHYQLASFELVRRLAGQHVWREELLAERFEWGRELSIYAIVVKVRRLVTKIELPMAPAYGGCKSWVELAHSEDLRASEPVLAEPEFAEKLRRFREALA